MVEKSNKGERAGVNILKERYYILFFKTLVDIRLLPYFFVSKELAKTTLKRVIPTAAKRKAYKVVKGNAIHKYSLKLYQQVALFPMKYNYPPELKTYQDRKSHRTLMRRRLRRMDLLVINPSAYNKIKAPTKRVKAIKNQQTIAKCPNTAARVLQIDGKGTKNYYYIRKVLPPTRIGELCILKTWCFNFRKFTITKKTLKVNKRHMLRPFLINHLIELWQKNPKMPKNPKLQALLYSKACLTIKPKSTAYSTESNTKGIPG